MNWQKEAIEDLKNYNTVLQSTIKPLGVAEAVNIQRARRLILFVTIRKVKYPPNWFAVLPKA